MTKNVLVGAIDTAEPERVVGAEQLEVLHGRGGRGRGSSVSRAARLRDGYDGRDVVARVGCHDGPGRERLVGALHAAAARVLDQHRHRLHRLAVAHRCVSACRGAGEHARSSCSFSMAGQEREVRWGWAQRGRPEVGAAAAWRGRRAAPRTDVRETG
jgi:hypothetical protein